MSRTYFEYDIKCECHSPNHIEMVRHCEDCVPNEPLATRVNIRTEVLKGLLEAEKELNKRKRMFHQL